MLLRCAKKCFRRVQFSFCEAKFFMMAANEQIKSAVCLPKNKQLADFFLLCEMETERIAVSSLAYTIFWVNIFRPAGISAKACVCCIQNQPGSCRMLRKFFLICGFSIFCHRIWKRTEMEIITAYNLNGMCSIRKNGKPRVLMATTFAWYYKRNVLFCYRRCVKSGKSCILSVCIRLPGSFSIPGERIKRCRKAERLSDSCDGLKAAVVCYFVFSAPFPHCRCDTEYER